MKPSRHPFFLVALLALVVLLGCGGSSSDRSSTAPTTATIAGVSKINGKVPPGRSTAPNEVRLIRANNRAGSEVQVFRSERLPGTRAAIHTHPYGGVSCVVQGEMTLYMEGGKPLVADKGDCYWMPPGKAMSAASTGTTRSITLDYFSTPPGKEVWKVVETGKGNLQDQYGSPHSH